MSVGEIVSYAKGAHGGNGLLYEVPAEKGNQRPKANHYEERCTGSTGYLPGLWD